MPPLEDVVTKLRSSPEPQIYCLAKFGKPSRLEDLRQGRLRFRHHAFYRKVETGKAPEVYQDVNDGIGEVLPSAEVVIHFTASDGSVIEISAATGAIGGVVVSYDYDNPILCMHAFYALDESQLDGRGEVDEMKKVAAALQVPQRMSEYGTHVWFITNGTEFFRRIDAACVAQSIRFESRLVRYIDADEVRGKLPLSLQPYVKLREFEQERELRIVLGSATPLPDPFILDVGALDDISQLASVEDFKAGWTLKRSE